MHKRILPVIALGAVATLGLAACTGGSGSADGSTDGEGQELTVWIMKGTNPDASAFYDAVSEAFEEETGATVTIEEVQWADAHDRFVTSIAGGTTPDIAETGTTWTAEFADAGALLPIDEYVDAEAGLRDDLVEGLAVAGTYDEKLYGMPWYAGVRALMYRTDVFEELGLEVPTTWDEIVTAGEAIKAAKPEMMAFPVPGDAEFQVYPWVWGAGGEIATLEGDTWTSELDSAESRAGLQFYTDLATKHGFSSAGATTWRETDLSDAFSQGNVAMMLNGSWTPNALVEANPELEGKIGAATIPAQDGGVAPSVLGGSHLSVFNTTKNADLAWEFVKLMTTGEFAEQWAAETGYFPGVASAMEEALASTDPLIAPFAQQMVEGGASVPVTPNFGAVQAKKTTNAMLQSILSGQKDVETATKEAAVEMTDLLNK
ncbi:sugar ABC transporter substrate-binding protein [Microbacterium esteraromaticum]|uniref:sugar ABC transporter substrate-binding protein n=1 Tax=Microbacterium esteraromaticum TaxID=57043 RepID=UPI0019D3C167|nr:sugar ABC transporter substrate-binding protein [Microbacterium esteraromaticum]MBN7793451.1 sugar ABC transporter substrate-binding protein [Microbacterium esteraromaticum]